MGAIKETVYTLTESATQLSLHAILHLSSFREGIILGWVRWETGKSLGRKEGHFLLDKCSLITGDQEFSRRTVLCTHTSMQLPGINCGTSQPLVPPPCYFPFPYITSRSGRENFAQRTHQNVSVSFLRQHLVRSHTSCTHLLLFLQRVIHFCLCEHRWQGGSLVRN